MILFVLLCPTLEAYLEPCQAYIYIYIYIRFGFNLLTTCAKQLIQKTIHLLQYNIDTILSLSLSLFLSVSLCLSLSPSLSLSLSLYIYIYIYSFL